MCVEEAEQFLIAGFELSSSHPVRLVDTSGDGFVDKSDDIYRYAETGEVAGN